jgi:hypothetical protein
MALGPQDVRGFGAFFGVDDVELDDVPFGERRGAFAFNRREVDEDVTGAVLTRDEAVAFLIVKPLHGAAHTDYLLGAQRIRRWVGRAGKDMLTLTALPGNSPRVSLLEPCQAY